ncbi:hypothetical protein HIM_02916 [Hirsutella minnesotensis 3608]|nr:hypothetical protein HIM_02916 [Hirsutella minnesotensis 3608]
MPSDIEAQVQAAIDAGKVNGVVICAADAEGSFVYEKALGQRTLLSGEQRPQRVDDVLYLASATKLMTTIAALQCVEDGLLTLRAPLSSVAPELGAKQVLVDYPEGDDGTPQLEPPSRPVTLEMLLTHSAGTGYDFLVPPVARWRAKFAPYPPEGQRRGVADAFSYPLCHQPGSGWMYGPGLDWVGLVVERVTGMTLGERIHQRLFGPLGITDAQFYPVTRDDLRDRLVDLNPDDPEGLGRAVVGGSGDMNKRSKGDFGGHGLFMTGADYAKVLRSLLANDGRLLRPVTVDDMFQNHLGPDAAASHQAALAGPIGPFFSLGIDPKVKMGYGLGGLLVLSGDHEYLGEPTLAWGGGLTLMWFIDRKNGVCGVGAVQAKLHTDVAVVTGIKETIRRGIYQEFADYKAKFKGRLS